jgi:uncharacterized membrane protein YfcA
MGVAGVFSALLGIGAGVFKVLVLERVMGVPLRAASATSSLMLGVTASTAAWVYYARGDMRPEVATPVAVGVLLGSRLGALILPRLPLGVVRLVFTAVLIVVAVRMLVAGIAEL